MLQAMNQRAGARQRVSIMGIEIDRITHEAAVARIRNALAEGRGGWVVTPNLDILRQLRSVPAHRELVSDADLVLADGMPLVWASRLQGTPLPERVAGSDLVWSIPEVAAELGVPLFLLGGEDGASEAAASILNERFPGLSIAGTLSPPRGFEQDEARVKEIVSAVARTDPRLVLVGLGFPKQEYLIRELRDACPQAWFLGVGIGISFLGGHVQRAPRWMQAVGLEWLHRFAQEPQRLAQRYFVHGLPFAARLLTSAALERSRKVRT